MPKHQDPTELEAWVHEELRKLPQLEAPAELRARIWARLDADAMRPWWRRSWWHWPKGIRLMTALPLFCLAILFTLVPWLVERYLPGSGLVLAPPWERMLDLLGVILTLGRAVWLVAQQLTNNSWLWAIAALAFISYLWFVGVGTFLVRFAQRRTASGGRE